MKALYNEIERYAAEWMRNLVAAGHIANGTVDERSITDLGPGVFDGCEQVHFFAGIGGWSAALRAAGWPDDVPVWTGSCPCQPFSSAGGRKGFADERHLWPVWFQLIQQCRPPVIFGEQVASPDGLAWLDVVRADLEGAGYAFAAFDFSAAGVGAPHIRQRLYFVALANGERLEGVRLRLRERRPFAPLFEAGGSGTLGLVADNALTGRSGWCGTEGRRGPGSGDDGATRGAWADCEWVYCSDGYYRPVEPGTFPLAHGVPARVGRLRAYGNAIVTPLAAEVIRAVMEILCD